MPIRADMRARYPRDWALRSRFVREIRARNRCEWCGVANHAVGQRLPGGGFRPAAGNLVLDFAGQGLAYPVGRLRYSEARAIADHFNDWCDADPRYIVIVLTTAHVHDRRPEAAGLLNLAALCQRCHNRHDRTERLRSRRRGGQAGQAELAL